MGDVCGRGGGGGRCGVGRGGRSILVRHPGAEEGLRRHRVAANQNIEVKYLEKGKATLLPMIRVSDPHLFDADPGPGFFSNIKLNTKIECKLDDSSPKGTLNPDQNVDKEQGTLKMRIQYGSGA